MKELLTAKQALEIQKKQKKCKPTFSVERCLNSVLNKIEIHAYDGYLGMYIDAYKLNYEVVQKLIDLEYIVEKSHSYDDENFEYEVYHICWDNETFEEFMDKAAEKIFK